MANASRVSRPTARRVKYDPRVEHASRLNGNQASVICDCLSASADMAAARFVRDYARRVLARLKSESDDEEE